MPTLEEINSRASGTLPGLLGIEMLDVAAGRVRARVALRPELLAPNNYLHAATIVGLADTACGFGAIASLPQGATSFTTIELKTNFLGTARDGAIACEATLVHSGRTTQIWDAKVTDETSGRTIALFRCTQLMVYGGSSAAAYGTQEERRQITDHPAGYARRCKSSLDAEDRMTTITPTAIRLENLKSSSVFS
jgi:1,4-dihydroxy-2-naphthoyl-CoA hydrolase